MIYRNSDLAQNITWQPETHPEASDRALNFLDGERSLLQLARPRSRTVKEINAFLEVAYEVSVERGTNGELLVRASDENLLLTGKTAEVLRSYLDDEPVSTSDRFDMTIRRSAI